VVLAKKVRPVCSRSHIDVAHHNYPIAAPLLIRSLHKLDLGAISSSKIPEDQDAKERIPSRRSELHGMFVQEKASAIASFDCLAQGTLYPDC